MNQINYAAEQIFEQINDIIDFKHSNPTFREYENYDEFHIRGKIVTNELINELNLNTDSKILDIGCAIGGTCRKINKRYNCISIGIDFNKEYIRSGNLINHACKQNNSVNLIHADALSLPFQDNTFDAIISQHVQMNIKNKIQFYNEINRVLKPKAQFAYYDILKGENNKINHPLPWAENSKFTQLIDPTALDAYLNSIGFVKSHSKDQTPEAISFFEKLLAKVKQNPEILKSQEIFMGSNCKQKLNNLFEALQNNSLILESAIWQKS